MLKEISQLVRTKAELEWLKNRDKIAEFALTPFLFAFSAGKRKYIFYRDDATCQKTGKNWHRDPQMLEAAHYPDKHGSQDVEDGRLLTREEHVWEHLDLLQSLRGTRKEEWATVSLRLATTNAWTKGLLQDKHANQYTIAQDRQTLLNGFAMRGEDVAEWIPEKYAEKLYVYQEYAMAAD